MAGGGKGSRDVEVGIRVYVCHLARFLFPIERGVLDDAEGVDPYPFATYLFGDGYRVLEDWGELIPVYASETVGVVLGRGFEEIGAFAPAVA